MRTDRNAAVKSAEYRVCFQHIAELLQHQGSGLNEMSKICATMPGSGALALSRQDATGMLFLLERNGVNLQYAGKQADELAAIYADAVARRCATSQWQQP